MASIFAPKKPAQPDYKADLLNTETSILKRLNTFIDETTNKWKATNDWIKKTGDQVNELLKRTFDLQRKVEGQIIDVENKAKEQFYTYDVKMQKFEDKLDGKYTTVAEHDQKMETVAELIKDVVTKVDKVPSEIKKVQNQIPKNTVTKNTVEDLVSELRGTIEKVANAIPQNVAKADLLAELRRELFAKFDGYITTDALKSVQGEFDSKVKKVADVSAATTRENKATQKDFGKLAAKVDTIKEDYVPSKMIPQIRQEMTKADLKLTDLINEVEGKIPTDYAKTTEVDVLREFQKDILNQFTEHKTEQNQSIAVTMSNIEQIMSRTSTNVTSEIEAFKKTLAETKIGEDANFMKNIIREIADEEIKQMRNANQLFQENVKNNIVEIKNLVRNYGTKTQELQASVDKLIKLATNK